MSQKQKRGIKETPQQILKKIESQSLEQKISKTKNILDVKQKNIFQKFNKVNVVSFGKNVIDNFIKKTSKYVRKGQNQRLILLSGFVLLSVYVCWKVQEKNDDLKRRMSKTKSYRQTQIDKQKQYISKHLTNLQFEAVPIKPDPQMRKIYKFEEAEGAFSFDTKEEFLEGVVKDYQEDGKDIDQKIKKQLADRGMI